MRTHKPSLSEPSSTTIISLRLPVFSMTDECDVTQHLGIRPRHNDGNAGCGGRIRASYFVSYSAQIKAVRPVGRDRINARTIIVRTSKRGAQPLVVGSGAGFIAVRPFFLCNNPSIKRTSWPWWRFWRYLIWTANRSIMQSCRKHSRNGRVLTISKITW